MKFLDYEKEHIDRLRGLIAECTVMLKKNGEFPLTNTGNIALFGSGARRTLKGGTGSGEVNSRYFVTVEKGLKNAGFNITTEEWLDAYDAVVEAARVEFIKGIKEKAKSAHMNPVFFGMGSVMPEPEYDLDINYDGDACIYVLSRICGEGNDRQAVSGDIMLSESEKRDILELNRRFKKFMLVLNVGGPVDLSSVSEVENVLVLSQLGIDTGNILAAIILGKAFPSGKLTTTWANWGEYPEFAEFGKENDTHYREGVYVGYRYFDSVGKKPAFPFGFGLGYTDFNVTTDDVTLAGTVVTVKATAENIGSFDGMETIQVYLSSPDGKLDKPYQSLAAFAKTDTVKPGAAKTLSISFDLKEQASYDQETARWILEKGSYIVRVGNCSANTCPAAVICLDADAPVAQVKNSLDGTDFKDYIPDCKPVTDISGIKNIELKAEAIECKQFEYDVEYPILSETNDFSDEELVRLNIGNFSDKHDIASIIGSAGMLVAGAAGESSSILADRDVPPIVMADGPAGLRLAKDYVLTKDGQKTLSNPMIEGMSAYMNAPEKLLFKLANAKKPKGELAHHYCTAIPIGTAIAQSWNVALAEACGDIVGDEMERMGVHLWLAPALNIHRDIRCGRNFEYYSEDPLISGKMAAAITNGVQKHKGCGTTIKHYAANNQELNRYNNNSCVSERAMREIYLKGFEIAVKESQPKTLMTSYNLLNGIHTSERRDLIEDILRTEFGFEGFVMTDWVISNGMMGEEPYYPAPEAYKVALAGNDMFMPGSRRELDNIMKALADGSITRHQLQVNATRIINMARELNDR